MDQPIGDQLQGWLLRSLRGLGGGRLQGGVDSGVLGRPEVALERGLDQRVEDLELVAPDLPVAEPAAGDPGVERVEANPAAGFEADRPDPVGLAEPGVTRPGRPDPWDP